MAIIFLSALDVMSSGNVGQLAHEKKMGPSLPVGSKHLWQWYASYRRLVPELLVSRI